MEVLDWLTSLQYPSMRSAMFSAVFRSEQVMVRISVDPATLSCRHVFSEAETAEDELVLVEEAAVNKVWMDCTWLKSAR